MLCRGAYRQRVDCLWFGARATGADAVDGHCMQLAVKRAVHDMHHQRSRLGALYDLYQLEHHADGEHSSKHKLYNIWPA